MLFSIDNIMDEEFSIDNIMIEYHQFPNMVCALLPQIANVRIKSFKLEHYQSNTIRKTAEYKVINRIINYGTSNHQTSTCFMLFCNHPGKTIAKRWASTIKERYNLYLIQGIIHI